MSKFARSIKRAWWVGSLCGLCLASCVENDELVSWEQFRTAAVRNVDGEQIFVVEWDQAVSEDELRARYDRYVQRVESETAGLGEIEQHSIVNDVGWDDDIWHSEQQLNLTYCVSDTFGAAKARVVSEMAAATRAWEQVARVNFNYLSAHDANCSNTNPGVVFSVRPWMGGGACSFFPSGGGCVARTLVVDLADIDSWGATLPNVRLVGVLRHELGHILGLRHEHIHPSSGVCAEGGPWRSVTDYDRSSVMHYPQCNGVMSSDLSITANDAVGASRLYGGSRGNLAAGRATSQSTTAFGGSAALAVDRNVDGNWGASSVTHTDFQYQPWWQVDLGAASIIGHVVINNRTDCCGDRLADFNIEVSMDGSTWQTAVAFVGRAFGRTTHTINRYGRFVRIRLRGTNYLSLAEVQVFEPSKVLFFRNAFGGDLFAQQFTYTTPLPCGPGLIRTGTPEVVWNSNMGGSCAFVGWANPANLQDCRATIQARTGGGWFGGVCRVWVRETSVL